MDGWRQDTVDEVGERRETAWEFWGLVLLDGV